MTGFLRRLAAWLRHRQVQAEIEAEIAFHRETRQRALERSGAGRSEAARESLRTMGNITLAREEARAVWLPCMLESTWQDVRYALRALGQQPGFALLAIGALTAGIGTGLRRHVSGSGGRVAASCLGSSATTGGPLGPPGCAAAG